MNYSVSDIKKLKNIIYLVRCIAMKKSLASIDNNPHLNFWRLISGVWLDTSVVEWCKIFGSKNEDTHWTKSITTENKRKDFQVNLLKLLKINDSDWKNYIVKMKIYRDKYTSHTDLDNEANKKLTNYPTLDYALESTFFYYEQLWLEYKDLPSISDSELKNLSSLRNYYDEFINHTIHVAATAYKATRNISELLKT